MSHKRSRSTRPIRTLIAAVLTAAAFLIFGSSTAQAAAPSCTSVGSSFNTVLTAGHCIVSPNKKYKLIMQTDGNLVLYRAGGGAACWASSWGGGGHRAGDKARFSVLTIGINGLVADYEYALAVGHNAWSGLFWATYRYDVVFSTHIGNLYLNVNVNDKGELWVGYRRIGAC